MSKALVLFCGDECNETSQFVEMMDKFFDALMCITTAMGLEP